MNTIANQKTGELEPLQLAEPAALSPGASLSVMRDAAQAFREISSSVDLYATVQGGARHLTVEGYQALGLLIGVSAIVTSVERDGDGWIATAEARRLSDGMVVGAASALCSKQERKWSRADDYAICSMASARAQSRALRGLVAPIAKLADPTIETTAAEEMPNAQPASRPKTAPSASTSGKDSWSSPPARITAEAGGAPPKPISDKQVGLVQTRARIAGVDDAHLVELLWKQTGNTPPTISGEHSAAKLVAEALPRFPAAQLDGLLERIGGQA